MTAESTPRGENYGGPLDPVVQVERRKQALAVEIADYVETHDHYDALTTREAMIAAVRVLTDNIGAAHQFCYAIGIDIDLYATSEGAGGDG